MDKVLKERTKFLSKGVKFGGIYMETPEKKKKKKKEKVSNRAIYDITLSNFQYHLYTTICMINGIDTDVYVYADSGTTILNANLKIDDVFLRASQLDWKTPAEIDSLTFHGRFATVLLLKIAHNAHQIVKGLFNTIDEKVPGKYSAYMSILDEFIYHIDTFATTYLSADLEYAKHLQKIYEILLIAEGKDTEIMKRFYDVYDMLEKAASGRCSYDEGTIANNIMKMAYVLSTDSLKLKNTPRYAEDLDFQDYYGMGNQIGTLGYAILKRRIKTNETPMFYKVMQRAKPKLVSRFDETDEMPELSVGTKALTLLEIFIGDPKITEYIDRSIK